MNGDQGVTTVDQGVLLKLVFTSYYIFTYLHMASETPEIISECTWVYILGPTYVTIPLTKLDPILPSKSSIIVKYIHTFKFATSIVLSLYKR